ncbi:MAG TPA: substrate-binding domain-containing protein, partial [Herpetosiphonaceae bacterium]|nr:substrate-binding domain-containing protein [Herpetosiphonaceae bacterium]
MDDHDSLVQLAALVQDRVQGLSGAAPGRPGAAPLPPDVAAERARRVALRAALAMAAAMLDDPGPEGAEAATAGLAALEAALKSWRSSSRSWTEQRVIRRKQPLVEPGPDGAPLVRVVERVYGPYVYVRWRDERGRLRSRCLGLAAQTAGEPEAAAAERDAAAKPGAPAPTGLVARPARRRGPTVGVLVSYTTAGHIYSSGVLAGIHAALRERDGELIVFQEFTPRRILESGLGRRRVDGWIAALDTDGLAELAASGAPLVALGADGGPHCPSVMSDNRGGVCALVHHLIDHGHRRIAFVGSALGAADLRQRFEGYRAALEERGIAYDPALLYEVSAHGRREGREGGRRLIEAGMPCTAVVAGTDWNALGVIDALQAAGYRVPQDIAVVGFDNVDLGQSSAPPLTTVSQSLAALGAAAVRLLLERLGGQPAPAGITYVPSGRVLRRSCGCPGDQRTGAAAALLDRARAIALDELRDTSYSSYRITLPLLERGAAAIMDLGWLTEGNVSQGSLALWPGGAGSPGPSMFDSLPQPAPLGAPAGDAGPAVIVAGSYRRTEDRDEARQLRDACPAADFPSRESLPPTPAAGEVIKIFRIKTFTQPDEWGFLAIRGALDSYHEHIGMWAHMIGSIFERDTLVALLTRAKQAAEQANRLKTQFLSTVSHELRTPLNAIAGFAELLPEDAGAAPPHLRERILANASHLRALIGDLLDTARLDAGRLELHRRTVDLRPLIQGALATAAGLIRERQLELRLELPADLPPVTADPLRIRQVLLNLLANAAKFTPHGSITVSAERRAAAPGGTPQLVVAVRDTGIGIAPADRERVLAPFRRSSAAERAEIQGSGLGLTIVAAIVDAHGGTVEISDNYAGGTTITL